MLPKAQSFTGREEELAALDHFWDGEPGVLSLVGVGGAGKTALTERLIAKLLASAEADGLFVWSFYDEPDANVFLREAFRYFSGNRQIDASGAGWFHALKECLATGSRYLLVLDGLERIQRPSTEARGVYGEIEDPLLRGLLRRLVAGVGQTKVLITSRFPVSDLESYLGKGYTVVNVEQLDPLAARTLLAVRGVKGSPEQVAGLLSRSGRHALTLDLLAGAIVEFFESDPDRAGAPSASDGADDGGLGSSLAHTLSLYLEHLDERSLDLLSRLCVFRFGVTEKLLSEIFLSAASAQISGSLRGLSTTALTELIDRLERLHLTQRTGDTLTVHPAVRDHFYRLFREPADIHGAVSKHLMSLSGRPGVGLPTEKATLDLLEELVYHAIKAGKIDEAAHVYVDRMGGNDHLNVQLGEYGRTLRILRAFPECPDPSGMYHCYRAIGRFEDALEWRPQNRHILLLTGELERLCEGGHERASRIAWYLRGEATALPPRLPDFPLPVAWLMMLRSQVEDARRLASHEVATSIFADDVYRNMIALAEAERRSRNLSSSLEHLEKATAWVLPSASHEHLSLYHYVRARVAFDEGAFPSALSSIEEALQVSRESSFWLLMIDQLADLARIQRAMGRVPSARTSIEQGLEMATASSMQYVWGEKALRLELARLHFEEGDAPEGLKQLRQVAEMLRRIEDTELSQVEREIIERSSGSVTESEHFKNADDRDQ